MKNLSKKDLVGGILVVVAAIVLVLIAGQCGADLR